MTCPSTLSPSDPDKDFYWDVGDDDFFEVRKDQPELGIGRFSDDLEFLQYMSKERHAAVFLMLIHITPLLRHISESIGQ
jgi:hypothetical protein